MQADDINVLFLQVRKQKKYFFILRNLYVS